MEIVVRLTVLILLFGFYSTFDVPRREKLLACVIAGILMIIGVFLL